jgi:hypothetical protein
VLSFKRPALERAHSCRRQLGKFLRAYYARSECLVRFVGPLPSRHVNEINFCLGVMTCRSRSVERTAGLPPIADEVIALQRLSALGPTARVRPHHGATVKVPP